MPIPIRCAASIRLRIPAIPSISGSRIRVRRQILRRGVGHVHARHIACSIVGVPIEHDTVCVRPVLSRNRPITRDVRQRGIPSCGRISNMAWERRRGYRIAMRDSRGLYRTSVISIAERHRICQRRPFGVEIDGSAVDVCQIPDGLHV